MQSKIINIGELPKELYRVYSIRNKLLFETPSDKLHITQMKTKSNVADINGLLYYFGNTYGNINPYKNIRNMKDLISFILQINKTMDELVKGHLTDITYLSVSDLMNDQTSAKKLLTSHEAVYPDYTVEFLDNTYLTIEIDEDNSAISTKNNLIINKLGSFDLTKLFKMEYLNSLYIIKMAHRRDLDLRGIMNLIPQLQVKKMIDVVHMVDTHDNLTVCLHIPENFIHKVFAYKLKKRTTTIRIDNLTNLYILKIIKS